MAFRYIVTYFLIIAISFYTSISRAIYYVKQQKMTFIGDKFVEKQIRIMVQLINVTKKGPKFYGKIPQRLSNVLSALRSSVRITKAD